jgi:hypothetical protein
MYALHLLLLTFAAAGTQAATETPQVRVASPQSSLSLNKQGAETELAHGGKVFRTTSGTVSGAQVAAIPGSSGVTINWIESDAAGNGAPWYAISLDGTNFDTVQTTSYSIDMHVASFDPLAGLPELGATGLVWDGEIHFVQFTTQVLAEHRAALEALGARVYDHVVNHTLVVRMSPAVRARVAALDFVRWVGPFQPELRLEPEVLGALIEGRLSPKQFYNVAVYESGLEQKQLVAARIAELGGTARAIFEPGYRFEAELTPEQLVVVVGLPEVAGIDRWGLPGHDMDIVRNFSGANYLESQTGFTGQGVRGECFDTGVFMGHQDFQHDGGVMLHGPNGASTSHGTMVTGVVFGNGTGNPSARGLLPNGKIVFGRSEDVLNGAVSRYLHTAELINPALPYKCVFQTNSTGSPQTSSYTSISQEMDDILYINNIVILQSQSNTGSTASRPQAWAKNIVSVGGINHQNTLTKNDDFWAGGSIGPATDGRLKPDLAHFYDSTLTTSSSGGYGEFSGTSNATPCTAGHFGLFFQMWHNNVWNNGATGATVFDSRPGARTARAALINSAGQWTFSGANHNLTRTHQGWGYADMVKLYDQRNVTFIVNETDVLDNLGTNTYMLNVSAGTPEFKATMVYRDPKAVNFAGTHRINDLTLKVTSPGGTIFFGNNGLNANMWSTSGGVANTKDVVENVFVQNPQVGAWKVEILGSDINTDTVPNTPGTNANYALWVSGVGDPCTAPIPYCTAKTTSLGGTPVISANGTPSIGGGNFSLGLTGAMPSSSAVPIWGFAPGSTPFGGGTLCIGGTVTRGPASITDALGATSFSVPMTGTMIGQTFYYQWWFRDTGFVAPNNMGLSGGLEVTFCN